MRNLHCISFFLAGLFWVSSIGHTAEISWSRAFEIETDADIDVSNEIVRAVNVVNPDIGEVEVEFPSGISVEFEPEHTFEFNTELDEEFFSNGNVTGDGNFYSGQDEALTTENDDLDRVLDSHGWAGAGPGAGIAVVELAELTVGTDYQIQLVGAADDRGCCEYRQMQIVTDDPEEPVSSADGEELWFGRSNDFDQDDERGPGSVIGIFTADSTEQLIKLIGTADFDDGNGGQGNGNDPGLSMYILSLAPGGGLEGDFNNNGELDVEDINTLTTETASQMNNADFDLTADGKVNIDDINKWVKDLRVTWSGDSNLDGLFDSGDLVGVFQEGKFETGAPADWEKGDWNGDGVFDSTDFVQAFQDGGYEAGERQPAVRAVPEPSSMAMTILGILGLMGIVRQRGK